MKNNYDENRQLITYLESIGLSEKISLRAGMFLYHGLRFDAINKLESIFQTNSILCGNKINYSYKSYDGTTKYLYINTDSDENCNMGEYVSVMPYVEGLEFDSFVRRNIFFAIKGSIDAYKTTYVPFDDYCDIRDSKINDGNLYSYAHNEYLVKNKILLDDCIYIGIDSKHYYGDYEKDVEDIINLIDFYEINLPFKDIQNNNELYSYESVKVKKKNRT